MTAPSPGPAQIKVVVYYGVWVVACAVVAGFAVSLIHTFAFAHAPSATARWQTLGMDLLAVLAIAAGQGAVAVGTGGVLARLGRGLRMTVLLGLIIGLFDFVMLFVQMALPATELGWTPDVIILAGVAAGVTVAGATKRV